MILYYYIIIKRNVLYIRHIHETFSYYSRKYSNDNEALSSLFDFGDTCLFPFGDTRYQSNHLIDSNTCINNKNVDFHCNETILMLLDFYEQALFGM